MKTILQSLKANMKEDRLVYVLALSAFIVHLATGWQYGYFRDELYYVSMSNHLDFGYVDISPIVPWLMRISRFVFGDSVFAFHILPALCAGIIIMITANIAKKMGGGKFACLMAGIAVFAAPMFRLFGAMFTYDIFDQLTSAILIYTIVLILNANEQAEYKRAWILFGIAAGVGLMVKITIMFLVFAFAVGLLLTKNRKFYKTKYLWFGAFTALLIFSPYIVWQALHGFPILEYWGNYASRIFEAGIFEYILMEIVMMNPLCLPLLIGGVYYLLHNKNGRKYSIFGHALWIYLAIAIFMSYKFYILSGAFLAVVSAGAILLEKWFASKKAIRSIYVAAVLLMGLFLLPVAVPVLPVETFISVDLYSLVTGAVKAENIETVELPQHFADRFGWEELAKDVSNVYHSLPAQERNDYAIFAMNYGQAGAIDLLGQRYGLPTSISGQLSHYIWGPGEYDLNSVIIVGYDDLQFKEDLRQIYDQVEHYPATKVKYAIPYENERAIFTCKGLKIEKNELWGRVKNLS